MAHEKDVGSEHRDLRQFAPHNCKLPSHIYVIHGFPESSRT